MPAHAPHASPPGASSTGRGVRVLTIILVGLLAGSAGSAIVNWRSLGVQAGLLPPPTSEYPAPEVRRETLVEESAFAEAVTKGSAAIGSLIAASDAEKARDGQSVAFVGTALALTDDGLVVLLQKPLAPKDLALVTRSGFVVSITPLAADPWSSLMVARASLVDLPRNELVPLTMSDEIPLVGQRLIRIAGPSGMRVEASTVADRPRTGVPAGSLIEHLPLRPTPEEPGLYVDLSGALAVVALQDDIVLSGPSVSTLLRTTARTGAVQRAAYGLAARDILPGQRSGTLRSPFGALVTSVTKDGPAFTAGILENDLITSVNGRDLTSEYRLLDALVRHAPGQGIDLSIRRGADTLTQTLTAGTQ